MEKEKVRFEGPDMDEAAALDEAIRAIQKQKKNQGRTVYARAEYFVPESSLSDTPLGHYDTVEGEIRRCSTDERMIKIGFQKIPFAFLKSIELKN